MVFSIKSIDESTKNDIKAVKSALRIMQSIFKKGKQQKQISKELNLSKGHVSGTINSLMRTGLVDQDKIDRVYFVPVESLVIRYAEHLKGYNEKNIERIIKIIRKKGEEISTKHIEEEYFANAKLLRSNPPLMFMVLLSLGFKEGEWGEYETNLKLPEIVFLSRHFKDMELTDFEKIFSELETVPLDKSLQLKFEKAIFLIRYNLRPVLPLKYIFEADSLFFKLMKLDLRILYETWGNFLYENKIVDYGLKIPEINPDFIKKFNEFGDICLDFLLRYQSQLTFFIFWSDLFKDEDLKKSRKSDLEEDFKDFKDFKDEETKKRAREILNLNSEHTLGDAINMDHPSQTRWHLKVNQERDPIFPIIRLQKTGEMGFNWGSVEIKNLEYAYKEKVAVCVFFGSCNLWKSFIQSIIDLNSLVTGHPDSYKKVSEEFYRGLDRFTKNYLDEIMNEFSIRSITSEYDDHKRWITNTGFFVKHFEEYGEKKILSYTEKNEEE